MINEDITNPYYFLWLYCPSSSLKSHILLNATTMLYELHTKSLFFLLIQSCKELDYIGDLIIPKAHWQQIMVLHGIQLSWLPRLWPSYITLVTNMEQKVSHGLNIVTNEPSKENNILLLCILQESLWCYTKQWHLENHDKDQNAISLKSRCSMTLQRK